MALSITRIDPKARLTAEALIIGLFSGETIEQHPLVSRLSRSSRRYLTTFVKKGFSGEKDEVDFVVFPSGKPEKAFLVGLGKKKEWTRRRQHLFFRRLVGIADQQNVQSIALSLRELLLNGESGAEAGRQGG